MCTAFLPVLSGTECILLLPVFNRFGRVNCFRVQNFLENSCEPLLPPKTYFKQEITLSIGLPA